MAITNTYRTFPLYKFFTCIIPFDLHDGLMRLALFYSHFTDTENEAN